MLTQVIFYTSFSLLFGAAVYISNLIHKTNATKEVV